LSDDIFDRALDRRNVVIEEQRRRIKALEHDLMWTDRAWEAAQEAVVYGYTLMDRQDARIKALEEDIAIWNSVFPDLLPDRLKPDKVPTGSKGA
jgi:hypothetical protein